MTIPPLRERPEDILPLARYFLEQLSSELTLDPGAEGALIRHRWPGNVRELRHVIETARIRAGKRRVISESDLDLARATEESYARGKERVIEEFERNFLLRVLTENRGNITRAARSRGMDRRTLQRLLEKHGIDPGRFRDGSA